MSGADAALAGIESALGTAVVRRDAVGGGDISGAFRLHLADGRACFAKTRVGAPRDFFEVEVDGLRALAAAGALRVPEVLAVGSSWIALEWIQAARPSGAYWEAFGGALALQHRRTARLLHGWHRDGYIGRTPQPNPLMDDAAAFWRDARLAPQLARARANGRIDAELGRLGDRLLTRLPDLLPTGEPAGLLHGDLWSGNAAAGENEAPVVFDPAAYYGPREAELAMCHLFGGFDPRFFDAYEAVWPLTPGAETRRPLYALYHLLNHLNLFGAAYLGQVRAVLRRYA